MSDPNRPKIFGVTLWRYRVELLLVFSFLVLFNLAKHSGWQEWVALIPVIYTFRFNQISSRLGRAQNIKEKKVTNEELLFWLSRACWILFYILIGAYIPILGALIIITYPIWQNWLKYADEKDSEQVPEEIRDVILEPEDWILSLGELALLTITLVVVELYTPSAEYSWILIIGILLIFRHTQIVWRHIGIEEKLDAPLIPCYGKAKHYYFIKEVGWIIYFVCIQAYPAIAASILFLLFPIWRKWLSRKRYGALKQIR